MKRVQEEKLCKVLYQQDILEVKKPWKWRQRRQSQTKGGYCRANFSIPLYGPGKKSQLWPAAGAPCELRVIHAILSAQVVARHGVTCWARWPTHRLITHKSTLLSLTASGCSSPGPDQGSHRQTCSWAVLQDFKLCLTFYLGYIIDALIYKEKK